MALEYPRVTEILKPFTHYDQVPKQIMEKAAARGTSVHALCAGIAKGNWIPDAMIQDDYRGYVDSFKKWQEAQVKSFVIIEKRYQDEELGYTGQLDFVVMGHDGDLYLVDLKTSARPQKTYPVQMAAYDHLLKINNVKVKGAMLVYLDKEGDFPEIHYMEDLTPERHVFFSALDCWHYFNKRKSKDGNRSNRSTEGSECQASA